jgi:pimeloyl-ACP methyl ester carboxylesterase
MLTLTHFVGLPQFAWNKSLVVTALWAGMRTRSKWSNGVFVGHSVSSMIGALASIEAPQMFADLVMVCPSPRCINDGDYVGGFAAHEIDALLASLADNHRGWSAAMAPAIMSNANRPELGEELTNSFAAPIRKSPESSHEQRFTGDNRADRRKSRRRRSSAGRATIQKSNATLTADVAEKAGKLVIQQRNA